MAGADKMLYSCLGARPSEVAFLAFKTTGHLQKMMGNTAEKYMALAPRKAARPS
jgi:hypothetical protein